ncbi:hypothetical protein BJX64DRAFT_295145 [Aspergillus heterothallicus]
MHLIYGLVGEPQTTNVVSQLTTQEQNGESQIRPVPALSLDIASDSSDMNNSSPSSPTSTKSHSPFHTSSPTPSEARSLRSSVSDPGPGKKPSKHGQNNTKRAVQNRAAQRRFRERRDQQNRSLREKAESLQELYEELGEKLDAKSNEASQAEKENEKLRNEIQDLQRRWRTMVLLLQRPKSLQFLSMFVGDSGLPIDDLDGYVRCLDALIFTDKTTTSTS